MKQNCIFVISPILNLYETLIDLLVNCQTTSAICAFALSAFPPSFLTRLCGVRVCAFGIADVTSDG